MEYLYKVLGIKATVQRAEFDHLPNYIAVRYRLQKVSMDGQKVIFLYPKTELEQIKDLKAQLKSTGDAILAECAVKGPHLGHRLIDEGPRSTRREKVARNEPAGVCTHDRTRTGVKGENPDTNINTYLMIYRYE